MNRLVVTAALLVGLAAAVSAPAEAATQVLMPGVTYSRQVQFTAHGPVVINVMTAPKPGGLYSLKPVLANGTILGRQRVTAMQKAISRRPPSQASTATSSTGRTATQRPGPAGRRIKSPPIRTRSSIGISSTGTLNVARVALYGYWQGLGSRRTVSVNRTPKGEGSTLYTPAWGTKTPVVAGSTQAVFDDFPRRRAEASSTGP